MTNSADVVTIDRFLFAADAAVARSLLESAGIVAVIADENAARMTEAFSNGGVRLQVRRDDAARAMEILRNDAMRSTDITPIDFETAEMAEEHLELCRRCGSEEIYPAEPRSRTVARVLAATWLVFLVIELVRYGVTIARLPTAVDLFRTAYAVIAIGAFVALIALTVSPKKRCRGCGLEWRGVPRTA